MAAQSHEQGQGRVVVQDNPSEARFEIRVAGRLAGFTEYRPMDGGLAFPHTQIDEAYAGQGLATTLIRGAMDAMRERGVPVLPYCPFVRGFLGKHREYLELVPVARLGDFNLISQVERGNE